MPLLTWRSIAYGITFILFSLAILLWILTIIGWLITAPGFEPINVLVGAIVTTLATALGFLKAKKTSDTPFASSKPSESHRRIILERVQRFWVKGVLEDSLYNKILLELGLTEKVEAIQQPSEMILQAENQPARPLPVDTKIINLFDDASRALLILGEPGSGKTTILLELARDTIARARENPTEPIPIVLNLSSWKKPENKADANNENAKIVEGFEKWLIGELNSKYAIPPQIGQSWIKDDAMLLLFDGLDEVDVKYRNDCVDAINGFIYEHLMPIVVCSRVSEYTSLKTKLRLQTAIVLQPLTDKQIHNYLVTTGLEHTIVGKILQQDKELWELARSPLMLSIITLAIHGLTSVSSLGTIQTYRKRIFETYVKQMIKRKGANKYFDLEQTINYLAWLAKAMLRNSQTIFLPTQIQPDLLLSENDWSPPRKLQRQYSTLVGVMGALGALTYIVFVSLSLSPFSGEWIIMLVIGFGAWAFFFSDYIDREKINLVVRHPLRIWAQSLLSLLIIFLGALASVAMIAIMLFPMVLLALLLGRTPLGENWQREPMLLGLLLGLIFAFIITCFILYDADELFDDKANNRITGSKLDLTYHQHLLQATKTFIYTLFLFWFHIGFSLSLSVYYYSNLKKEIMLPFVTALGIVFGIVPGLVMGLKIGGGLSLYRHLVLRFVLYRAKRIPWNLPRFLDYAVDAVLLRKVGSGYIFIHRLLMEYFASLINGPYDRSIVATRHSQSIQGSYI